MFTRWETLIAAIVFALVTPAAVFAANTDVTYPNTAGSVGGGNPAWMNYNNAKAADTTYATATFNASGVSDYLTATNFGFNIPSGATIDGVVVELRYYGIGGQQWYWGEAIQLMKNGAVIGDVFSQSLFMPSSPATSTYGGASDGWNASLTAADINDSTFGVGYRFTYGESDVPVGYIDFIRMTVYYTAPPAVTLSSGVGQCTGDACPQDFAGCGNGVASGGGTFPVAIGFSVSVTGFTSGDISVTNGSVQSLSGNGASYTATITSNCTDCLVEVSVGANVADGGNGAAGPLQLPWGQNYFQLCDAWCSSFSLPSGYTLVQQSDGVTPVSFVTPGTVVPARIRKTDGAVRIADFNIAVSGGTDACQSITVGQENQTAFLHGLASLLNADGGSYALYVPKIEAHTALRVCAGKTTLGCTESDDWSFTANDGGTITATRNGFDTTGITVAVAGGYWNVSGLTQTSAEGEGASASASSSSVPFFPWWALPIVLLGGV